MKSSALKFDKKCTVDTFFFKKVDFCIFDPKSVMWKIFSGKSLKLNSIYMHIFRQKFILISLALSQKTEFENWPIRTWFKYASYSQTEKNSIHLHLYHWLIVINISSRCLLHEMCKTHFWDSILPRFYYFRWVVWFTVSKYKTCGLVKNGKWCKIYGVQYIL